jgi:pimeloyl-ACP methyl ester carboxylesterase
MPTDKTLPTQYLELPEGRIAFDDTQTTGPLVICVPGLGDIRATYRFLAPALSAAGYRVVTMDLRGHGESSAGWSDYRDTTVGDDVLALIGHLNAGPAILIGNSYGGAAVAYAAAVAPASVAGLVLLDAWVRDLPQTLVQRLAIWVVARLGASAWISYYKSLYVSQKPSDLDAYLAALKANLRERGRFAATRAMMYGSHANVEAHLNQVKAPALIVMGSRDPDFPDQAGEARFTADRLSSAASTRIQMIEGAGHYPHAEMPEQVQAVLMAFLQQIKENVPHDA